MDTATAVLGTADAWESLRILEDQLYQLLKRVRFALDRKPLHHTQSDVLVDGLPATLRRPPTLMPSGNRIAG